MICGEINVERFRDIRERQARQLEWWYLRELWAAKKEDRELVVTLYGNILREALEKYYPWVLRDCERERKGA
jgi:hypothetical protein